MDLTPDALSAKDRYALLTSVLVPRPIAWVSTLSAEGQENLAPFSYFGGVGSDPMMISLAIGERRGEPKDTLRNLQDIGAMCVHLVEEPLVEAMNHSSGDFPYGESEIEACGLATLPCTAIMGVRLKAARVALECRLVDVHRYGRTAFVNLVVAEVVHVHLDDAILLDGQPRVDPLAITPVARLGGTAYAKLGERFHLARPRV